MLENIALRTNWIKTVEKLLGDLSLTEYVETTLEFKSKTKGAFRERFREYWDTSINGDSATPLF